MTPETTNVETWKLRKAHACREVNRAQRRQGGTSGGRGRNALRKARLKETAACTGSQVPPCLRVPCCAVVSLSKRKKGDPTCGCAKCVRVCVCSGCGAVSRAAVSVESSVVFSVRGAVRCHVCGKSPPPLFRLHTHTVSTPGRRLGRWWTF